MSKAAHQQDDWRSKYQDSLREAEDEQRRFRAQLKVMYKLVGRLCLAAQGQSPRLDAALQQLKDAVRRQSPGDHLEPIGQSITDAVHELDHGAATLTATELPSPPPRAARPPAEGIFGDDHVRSVLSRLLSELRRDPALAQQADEVDRGLSMSLTREQLPLVLEQVGGLVLQRLRALERARQELELLLGQMMGQLDSLTQFIAGQDEEEEQRSASNDALNLQITGEVRALHETVESDTDLSTIRRLLRDRMNSITRHLHDFRAREEARAQQSRERADRMRARMDEMEAEARKLQSRLTDEKRLSMLDPLTQIPNRRAYEQRVAEELERWKRFRQPTCIAAWDVDKFKDVNDRYGHRAGDKVLAVVAECLAKSIRTTDFVARYGGEEFVLILPGSTVDDARALAEQIRQAVSQLGFHFRGTPVSITISCGLTALREGDRPEDAFDRADKAMYAAKDKGRNRVESA